MLPQQIDVLSSRAAAGRTRLTFTLAAAISIGAFCLLVVLGRPAAADEEVPQGGDDSTVAAEDPGASAGGVEDTSVPATEDTMPASSAPVEGDEPTADDGVSATTAEPQGAGDSSSDPAAESADPQETDQPETEAVAVGDAGPAADPPVSPAQADCTVNNANDSGAGSLRNCVTSAIGNWVVEFAQALTIGLTTGEIVFNQAGATLTLDASGITAGGIIVNGGTIDRILDHQSAGLLTIINMVFSGGSSGGNGGAVQAGGPVTVSNSVFYDNTAGGNGGAIYAAGDVSITSSQFRTNTAGGNGGAVYTGGVGTPQISITNSQFGLWSGSPNPPTDGNTAGGNGGAIAALNAVGSMAITGGTFAANWAGGNGGAVYAPDVAIFTVGGAPSPNFVGNEATSGDGGAINAGGPGGFFQLTGPVFLDNQAPAGSGGAVYTEALTVELNVSTFGLSPGSSGNLAGDGNGGAVAAPEATSVLVSSGFFDNVALNGDGGAIYAPAGGLTPKSVGTGGGSNVPANGASSTFTTYTSSYLGNRAPDGDGGAIVTGAEVVTVQMSNFGDNSANGVTGEGGAIYAPAAVGLAVTTSTFATNSAGGNGGAIFADAAEVTVSHSTFALNVSAEGDGGAIEAEDATITNTTITQNAAGFDGGGVDAGVLSLTYVTIADNSAPTGANIAASSLSSRGSVVTGAAGGGNNCDLVDATTTSSTYSYASDTSCGFTGTGDRQNAASQLAALANNGGWTQTRLPLDGPDTLVNAIPPAACSSWPAIDQRVVARPENVNCDIGAVEVILDLSIAKTTSTPEVAPGGVAEFTIAVTNDSEIGLFDVTVTDTVAPACSATIGYLAAGSTHTYSCTLSGVTDTITNSALVTAGTLVGSAASDTVTITVVPPQTDVTAGADEVILEAEVQIAASELPFTGSWVSMLALVAFGLMALGSVALRQSRRRCFFG